MNTKKKSVRCALATCGARVGLAFRVVTCPWCARVFCARHMLATEHACERLHMLRSARQATLSAALPKPQQNKGLVQ